MSYQSLSFKIVGVAPLIMHNGQTADPLNHFAKEMKKITSKRMKTDADLEQLAKIEWYASLYTNNGKPCIPSEVIESCFTEAAKKTKSGKKALIGFYCPAHSELIYDGPSDPEEMWKSDKFRFTTAVRLNGRTKVMRTRCRFEQWGATIAVMFDPSTFNEPEIFDILKTAGEVIGLCDWRPKFGRFQVSIE